MDSSSYRQAPVSAEIVAQAVDIIGAEGAEEEEIVKQLLDLAGDELLAKRLREWIREAFGREMVFGLSGGGVTFLDTFGVFTRDRKPVNVPNRAEPILDISLRLARKMVQDGRQVQFARIAITSSCAQTALNAREQGASMEGATMATAFNGIPAEAYPDYPKSFWKRLLGN